MVYSNVTKETNNLNTLNTTQMESAESSNEVLENEIENTAENEIVNIVENEETIKNDIEKTDKEEPKEDTSEEETLSEDEKAIKYAKEYYEKEYGSSEGVNFTYDGVREDGSFIVRSGTVEKPIYFIVNVKTGEVSMK